MAREPEPPAVVLDTFVDLSAELTGFGRVELEGTGLTTTYCREVLWICGGGCLRQMLQLHPDPVDFFMKDPTAPLARRIIFLWYTGRWTPLPTEWLEVHGDSKSGNGLYAKNAERVVSSAAYREGLIWRVIGVNPAGAKHPGFGAWGRKP